MASKYTDKEFHRFKINSGLGFIYSIKSFLVEGRNAGRNHDSVRPKSCMGDVSRGSFLVLQDFLCRSDILTAA